MDVPKPRMRLPFRALVDIGWILDPGFWHTSIISIIFCRQEMHLQLVVVSVKMMQCPDHAGWSPGQEKNTLNESSLFGKRSRWRRKIEFKYQQLSMATTEPKTSIIISASLPVNMPSHIRSPKPQPNSKYEPASQQNQANPP